MNKTGTKRIETHRLILRRFGIADAEDMFENWAGDPEVTRFLTWPTHTCVEVSGMVLNDWIPRYEDGGFFNWAIELKETGRVIGNISVVKLNEATKAADIGYCLGRAFWGRGIMPEALRAVMDYLFDTVELNRVAACHDVNNPKSGRVMKKAGMSREGILRGAGKNNQGICDEVWYSTLKRDWLSWQKMAGAEQPGREQEPSQESVLLRTQEKPQRLSVRFARGDDLNRINELRKQVNDLHVAGKPEIFKPGFCDELRDYIYDIWADPRKEIVAAELDGKVCGFAVLNHITRPENPFMFERDYLDVDEFGVDEGCRRQGAASAMIRFISGYAKEKGISRLELNMWEFNRGALAFYEAAGFVTYRRYMEMR